MLCEKVEVRGEEEREEREKFLIFEAMAATITWGYVGLGVSQVALECESRQSYFLTTTLQYFQRE